MAVLFTDIVGSTELFERRGDVEGVAFIHRHNRLLFPLVEENGGRIVKTIGDAIMAVFEDPAQAVRCGADMQRQLASHRRHEPGETPIHIKIGIHFGKVVRDGEDVFGDAVNTAARLQSKSSKDEVLVSLELLERGGASAGVEAIPRDSISLKGKAEPLRLAGLAWGPEAPNGLSRPDREPDEDAARPVQAPPLSSTTGYATSAAELVMLEIALGVDSLKIAVLDGAADKGPVKSYAEVPISRAELESIVERMATFLGGTSGSYERQLAELGGRLFESALSPRAKERLRRTTHSFLRLHIDDSVAHVPWELLHDGSDHLALRFATGRVVSARDDEGQITKVPLPDGAHRALVVSNPTGDLPDSVAEGDAVASLLAQGFGGQVDHLKGPVPRESFLRALEGARLLHFAGHVTAGGRNGDHGFRFMDGWVTPEAAAERLGSSPTDLVFANACHAHDASLWKSSARGTFDVASRLLLRGVRHYLGPVGSIRDADALAFALRFYEEVLAGTSFGEATRLARESLRGAGPAPLSFARYVLYGEPRTVLPSKVARLAPAGLTRAHPVEPATVSAGFVSSSGSRHRVHGSGSAACEEGADAKMNSGAGSSAPTEADLSGRCRRRALTMAIAGMAVLGVAAWLFGSLFESREGEHAPEVVASDEGGQKDPAREAASPPPSGDIRMAVLDLRPMGGNLDPHMTARIRNTLNFALVGSPGIVVAERTDFDQLAGESPGQESFAARRS